MNIILMGYRASGKTTIGKELALQLWKDFVDIDLEIRKHFENLTIAEIWDKHGEPAFRQVEVQATRAAVAKADQVIALGGGTLMQPEARQAVAQAPDTVRIYLKCEPETLFKRISSDAQTAGSRPSLTTLGGSLQEIQAVLAQREPVYLEVADKVFDVTHVTAQDAVGHIIARCL